MWHYHGSYGFRHTDPSYPFGIRTKPLPDWLPSVGPPADVRMPWILVDRRGRRFMNEYEPYQQDTGARPLDRYLPERQEFAALPAWMILDAVGHTLWPLGRPTSNEPGIAYDWSKDNETEVKLGILRKATSITAIAREIGIVPNALEGTVNAWNAACRAGRDAEWSRPPTSMMPIEKPPFTYAAVWPIVSNTQGGPVHDARQRVLSSQRRPIAGLYAAGEVSSVFGHLYMSGGNVAECFVGGEIAGAEAARRSRARLESASRGRQASRS
jgi:succinate dehydrogenase/fumarate reductase flavoprotein subunit